MQQKNIKERLFHNKRPVFGTWSQLPCPEGSEIAAMLGYDFVIVDTEHCFMDMETATNHFRAIEAYDSIPIIRLVDGDRGRILHALDAGAKGILIPQVSTKEQAEKIVDAARFPPMGNRGTCPSIRATGKGAIDWNEYCEWSNRETLVIFLIETVEAVTNIEEIAKVPGFDAVLLGPYDLSFSMNLNGQVESPLVQEALQKVTQVCLANGKEVIAVPSWTGPGGLAGSVKEWYGRGCKLITTTGDAGAISSQFKQVKGMLHEFYI
jgi:4-hydroxy-2-oxoheptanedioate aldolase